MGKVIVQATLKNNADLNVARRGFIQEKEIRTKEISMVADTGAVAIGLPLSIIHELGLQKSRKVLVTLANGEKEERNLYSDLWVEILGRSSVFDCLGKPDTAPHLIGQVVLEVLDLVVDCKNQRLIPNPEAPEGMMMYDDF